MSRTAITSRLTTGLVALVAGYASFTHIYDVAREAGERASVAAVLPLSIDGLILVGTLAMLDDKRNGRKPRLSARLAVAFGVVATLAANIASAQPTITARLVAAVSPVAFLLAVEVLSRRGKLIRPEPVDQVEPVKVAEPVAVERVEPLAPEPVAEPAEVTPTPSKAQPVKRTSEPSRKPVPRSLTSADRIMSAHLAEPDATHARIAELAGVSVATVKRYRPTRSAGSPSPAQPASTAVNGGTPELAGVAA
ncbi:Protein of unknown function [Micromonospora echinaurantiaca]|uniref:DUF2637 domain-containing protein n=1 Tax=Micromonospora echinaurantiaca TaxID=47857 RepID=A0A1C5JGL5_9ACTN|nr:DUF2637 domain-containing protein [Micromonospora echinaurantiaca]SCG69702.1 Protein of unknown function [Micromonospora echinaurantiaca]